MTQIYEKITIYYRQVNTFTFSYKIAPFIELQAGTGYARLGGTYRHEAGTVVNQPSAGTGNKQTTSKVYFKDKYKMDFLEVPVLVKFFILPKRTISPFILAGGSYGFLLRSVNSYNFDDISVMKNDDMKNVSQNYFLNYCFGAGIDFFRDEYVSFGLSAKMSKSISKVFKYDKLEYASPDPENADYEYVNVYNMNTYFHSVALSAYVTRSF